MDRTINIKINGNYIVKDKKFAGVKGEGNSAYLRIVFSESWDEYAKTITFWDALGKDSVKRTFTTDYLEDISVNKRTYLIPIPPEAMAEAGYMTLVIDGWSDGKRQRSVADELEIKEAPFTEPSDERSDVTPERAEQLQKEIDSIIDTIQSAVNAEENALIYATRAEAAHTLVENMEEAVENARNDTIAASENAMASKESALNYANLTKQAQELAEAARVGAEVAYAGAVNTEKSAEKLVEEAAERLQNLKNIRDGEATGSVKTIGSGNMAITENSIALGKSCKAGCKGFYFQSVDFKNNIIYLSKTQVQPISSTEDKTDATFGDTGYAVNLEVVIVNNIDIFGTPLLAKITAIDKNKITLDKIPFNEISNDSAKINFYIYSPYSPNVTNKYAFPIQEGAYAEGHMNIAAGRYSHAEGQGNKALMDYGHAETCQ